MPGAIVIGAGPGIGRAVARRFAAEGMAVALIARTRATLDDAVEAVAPFGVPVVPLSADSSDETALRAALDAASDALGPPDVVVYNAAVIRPDTPGELTVREHQHTWAVNVVGALIAAAHIAPAMAARGGTFIITGGMPEPKPEYVSLSLGKAGVRTLVDLLDLEYGPTGVHVAGVTVAGAVGAGTDFDPDDIAEHYWTLHSQPRSAWQREVLHSGRGDGADRAGPDARGGSDQALGIVTSLLDRWREAFDRHREDDVAALFGENALFQGIGPEPVTGREAIRGYYRAATPGSTAKVRVLRARELGANLVGGFADVDFAVPPGRVVPVRLSVVAERATDGWLIRQYHAAKR